MIYVFTIKFFLFLLFKLYCCIPEKKICIRRFILWLQNRLEPVKNHVEPRIISRQFSMNIKIKIIKLKSVLLARAFGSLGLIKLVLFFNFSV